MSGNVQAAQTSLGRMRYRFGTFELEVQTGELRRSGVKVRLQEQQFLVLRRLLEGRGDLVTREELHGTLWPANTFVDFDTSLNTAIKRLREVLGDSADIPVFIETVPRRGYRFLAPVQVLHNGELLSYPAAATPPPVRARGARMWLVLVSLLSAAVTGGVSVALRSPAPVPRLADSTQITFDGVAKGNLHSRGANVYFNERTANGIALLKVPLAGGQPVVLDSSYPGLFLGDVSPDGTKLLVGALVEGINGTPRLKLMDLASGSLQDVDGIECNDVSWTPDGKLVFSKAQDVFLADADGTHQRKLLTVTAPGIVFFMRFSPDGKRLRFTLAGKLTPERTIWEARADGSGLHQILTDQTDFPQRCCGDWTPDGKYFLYQTTRNGAGKIWALPEHSSFWARKPPQPVPLTTVPPNFYMGVASADDKKLIVTAAQPRAELVRYDAQSQQFIPFLSGVSAGDVEASPDNRWFAYVKYPEETLWRSKADGTEAVQLTGPLLPVALPHWSPDGKFIAFSAMRAGHPWNVYLIPSAGGPAEKVTNGAISDLDPTWSPDGSKLAFGQLRAEGNDQVYSIQLLDVSSRHVTSLPGTDGICCPRWSPDGRFLLVSHATYNDLLVYEFATQKWSTLVKDKELGPIGYMEWAKDSKSVLFDTLETPDSAFYRIRLSDLRLETVTSLKDVRRYYGEFGPWTGMAPDGSPLLVRDISNEEVYALDLQLP